jgi:hypothetical protein
LNLAAGPSGGLARQLSRVRAKYRKWRKTVVFWISAGERLIYEAQHPVKSAKDWPCGFGQVSACGQMAV